MCSRPSIAKEKNLEMKIGTDKSVDNKCAE